MTDELTDEVLASVRENLEWSRSGRGQVTWADELVEAFMAEHAALQAERERNVRLREALEGCVDDDDCSFDHHGYCQTHGPGSIPCHMQVARDALSGEGSQ